MKTATIKPPPKPDEARIRDACLQVLQSALPDATLIHTDAGQHTTHDGQFLLKGPWGKKTLLVEIKRDITRTNTTALIHHLKQLQESHKKPPLLLTAYISPPAATALKTEHINFIDAVGNMFLDLPPLRVWQTGHKRELPPHRPSRLFQLAGLKLLTLLLDDPRALDATYRELATRAGIALGNVGHVLEELAKARFLTTRSTHRLLQRPAELLHDWAAAWSAQLFPRLFITTCRLPHGQTPDSLLERLQNAPNRNQLLVGGELAASLVTRYLRPATITLHIDRPDLPNWLRELRLIPDPSGEVDFIERFGQSNEWLHPPYPSSDRPSPYKLANPILIFGELLRKGPDDRLHETALLLEKEFISPRFGQPHA